MASFAALPDEQRWQVAFYVLALRFPADERQSRRGESWLKGKSLPADSQASRPWQLLQTSELSDKIKKSFPNAPSNDILAYLRRGLLDEKSTDPLLIARDPARRSR